MRAEDNATHKLVLVGIGLRARGFGRVGAVLHGLGHREPRIEEAGIVVQEPARTLGVSIRQGFTRCSTYEMPLNFTHGIVSSSTLPTSAVSQAKATRLPSTPRPQAHLKPPPSL